MIYTQEMYDNKELPKVGMKFSTCAGEHIALMTNEKSVVIENDKGYFVGINIRSAKPIDTRTDEEKAIDDLDLCITAANNDLINEYKQTKYFSTESSVLLEKIKDGKIHGVSFTESK